MSELKYYKLFHRASALTSPEFISVVHFGNGDEVYLKSEADKVIAELEKKLDLYKRGWKENDKIIAYLYTQLRHQKYKRCLAMARWCEMCISYWDDDELEGGWEYKKLRHCIRWKSVGRKLQRNSRRRSDVRLLRK